MEFFEYFKQPMRQYADFTGRTARKDFWMFVLISFLISIAIGIIETMIGFSDGFGLSGLYSLAVLIPSIAITVRRLHDTGKSGWWVLLGLIPLIGGLIVLIMCVFEGESGANKYGPVPVSVGGTASDKDGVVRDAEVVDESENNSFDQSQDK